MYTGAAYGPSGGGPPAGAPMFHYQPNTPGSAPVQQQGMAQGWTGQFRLRCILQKWQHQTTACYNTPSHGCLVTIHAGHTTLTKRIIIRSKLSTWRETFHACSGTLSCGLSRQLCSGPHVPGQWGLSPAACVRASSAKGPFEKGTCLSFDVFRTCAAHLSTQLA